MNPLLQSITALQSLGAATPVQQVKIHLVASWSPEYSPPTLPCASMRVAGPQALCWEFPHSIFAAIFPILWMQDLTGFT